MATSKKTPQKGAGQTMPQTKVSKVVNLASIDGELSFEEIVEEIKSDTHKDTTLLIRKLLKEGNTTEAEKVKKTLPGFTGSGIFNGKRRGVYLVTYSECIVLDFDKLPVKKVRQLVNLANQCKNTFISFISTSGCGIKILVRVNTSAEHHKEAYQQVMEYYEKLLGAKADKATKDVARLCFFAHDKNVYYNKAAEVFTVNLAISDPIIESGKSLSESELLFNRAVGITSKISTLIPGQRNNYIHLLACNCNRHGILLEDAIKYIPSRTEHGLPESEVINTINSAYSKNAKEFGEWSFKKSGTSNSSQPVSQLSEEKIEKILRKVLSEFLNPSSSSSLNSK